MRQAPEKQEEEKQAPMLSWGSMVRTSRAPIWIVLLVTAALTWPEQTKDMLAADIHAITAFHFTLFLFALASWYWSRSLLSARFEVPDEPNKRDARLRELEEGSAGKKLDVGAFELVPRLLFLVVAVAGIFAAFRSSEEVQAFAVLCWGIAGGILLWKRMPLQKKFGWVSSDGSDQPNPKSQEKLHILNLRKFWQSIVRLADYAPFGRWVCFALLGFGVLLLILALAESYLLAPFGTLKLALGISNLLPGPAALLFCVALMIGPLAATTFHFDDWKICEKVYGVTLRLTRPPVFLVLFGIAALTTWCVNLHAVRLVPPASEAQTVSERKSLTEYFNAWVETCAASGAPDRLVSEAPAQADSEPPLRPVVVAISGGASRAGLWGAKVLTKLDKAMAAEDATGIFAISSVSGGSLGAAAYLSYLSAAADDPPVGRCRLSEPKGENERENDKKWGKKVWQWEQAARSAVGDDALGPLLSAWVLNDIPRSIFGWPVSWVHWAGAKLGWSDEAIARGGDRTHALERAFEVNWDAALENEKHDEAFRKSASFERPFLSLFVDKEGQPKAGPVWIANGTDSHFGNRVLTVPFNTKAWPFDSAKDAHSLLKADFRVSTTVTNTARFPFLTPSGELSPLPTKNHKTSAQVIDGGYFENGGLLTALEIAEWLVGQGTENRPVQPIIVQVTDAGDVVDCGKDPDNIACRKQEAERVRCNSAFDPDPGSTEPEGRISEVLVPLIGLNNSRGGHSDALLHRVHREHCGGAQGISFFHFYLYSTEDNHTPLNWILSPSITKYIWENAVSNAGNKDEFDGFEKHVGTTE